jgi:hypothetical protein
MNIPLIRSTFKVDLLKAVGYDPLFINGASTVISRFLRYRINQALNLKLYSHYKMEV